VAPTAAAAPFSLRDAGEYIKALRTARPDQANIPAAAKKTCCSASEIVQAILNGCLTRKVHLAWFEIECSRCKSRRDVDLAALPHSPTTFVHELASSAAANLLRPAVGRPPRCCNRRSVLGALSQRDKACASVSR
jgi:hypothetical protein